MRKLLFLLALLVCASAHAEDKLWSAVIIASNNREPADPPEELKPYVERIARLFGYNQFELIGKDEKPVEIGTLQTLVPTPNFWFNLKTRKARSGPKGAYQVNLELHHDKRTLVDSTANIAPDSPVVFRGPLHARGQILILFQVQK